MLDLQLVLGASAPATAAGAALLGVAFHLAVRPYEIDNHGWKLLVSYNSALAALCVAYSHAGFSTWAAIARAAMVGVTFLAGLLSSIAIYRGFFHRLNGIPGPVGARFSRLYFMKVAAETLQSDKHIEMLHEKYGDFVRVGPREVSINRPSAIQKIYGPGPGKGLQKGPWYSHAGDVAEKISILQSRDFDAHRLRRRAWDRGFSTKALSIYAPRINAKVTAFLSRIGSGKPVDITRYCGMLGFDVMGDIGFGKDFDMLESDKEHIAIRGLRDSMKSVAIAATMPWLLAFASKIPGVAGGYNKFIDWTHRELNAKKKDLEAKDQRYNSDPQDIISWLIRASDENDRSAPPGDLALAEDSRLLVVAGSDTTSTANTNAFYLLSKHPEVYQKLQQAVRAAFPGGEAEWTYEKAKDIEYLNWIIIETLRLRPSTPVGLQRVTPPEGLVIDDQFIPGDTIVSVPCYTIHRDERYWNKAREFVPERWAELSTEKSPFIAFSRGPYSCPGKQISYMELRMVLSKAALRYDLSFAPGEDTEYFEHGAMETFTSTPVSLNMVFTPRE